MILSPEAPVSMFSKWMPLSAEATLRNTVDEVSVDLVQLNSSSMRPGNSCFMATLVLKDHHRITISGHKNTVANHRHITNLTIHQKAMLPIVTFELQIAQVFQPNTK